MTDKALTGVQLIEESFAHAKAEHRATFMPFLTVGYPDLATSIDVIEEMVRAGADMVEVGMPFSDPLSEGPTIQYSSQVALENGIRPSDCIEAVRTLRGRGVKVPLMLMGYFNPLMTYGLQRFAHDAAQAGASGFIIPDLPPEEAGEFAGYCVENGLALIPMLSPNSTPERIKQVTAHAQGFVYLVSVTGVTGARDSLPPDLEAYIRRVRELTGLPLAVGFGISRPEQAQSVAQIADGIIVGSALVRTMGSGGPTAVRDLAASLRAAC